MLNRNVLGIKIKDRKVEYVELSDKNIYANNVIISTGGKSFPATGSTGDGYQWLERIGHKINSPAPALAPIKIVESWVASLQGISLKDIRINLIQNNKKVTIGAGEMIFTHFGLSGPAVINASKTIGEQLKHDKVFLEIDLFPALSAASLEEKLKIDFEQNKKINLKNCLSKYVPQKLALALLELAGIEKDKKINSVNKLERKNISRIIKGLPVTISDLLDFNHAMVTSGGVDLKEINPKTMRSKIVDNLFLAGEILDLDGPTGGYNLQIAWTTGYTAGTWAKNES